MASEVVVGMSALAAPQVPAVLVAMQAGHERAGGQRQIEWDALPTVVALAARRLANTRDLLSLSVFADPMSTSLGVDGGTIMAERVMIPPGDPYRAGRETGIGLRGALVGTLEPLRLEELGPLDAFLEPESYLGETRAIVDAALEIWRTASARPAAAGEMAT